MSLLNTLWLVSPKIKCFKFAVKSIEVANATVELYVIINTPYTQTPNIISQVTLFLYESKKVKNIKSGRKLYLK